MSFENSSHPSDFLEALLILARPERVFPVSARESTFVTVVGLFATAPMDRNNRALTALLIAGGRSRASCHGADVSVNADALPEQVVECFLR